MTDTYPKFKAAVVQAAPEFLNREATIEKASRLILEAGENGAKLVVFPEVFVPGYPYWIWLDAPLAYGPWQRRLFKEAVEIPSGATDALCAAAKAADVYVVIGVNEKTSTSMSALWNTNLVIDRSGAILGKCRKLQPVSVEKVVWSLGDGSALRVFDTDIGKLGTLICGVNANPLARYALLAQGEQIHVANYPAFPASTGFDFTDQIRVRSRAHSHEGSVFTLVSNSTISQEMIDMLGETETKRQWLSGRPAAYSAIFGPGAEAVAELIDEEGILYADIDIEEEIDQKQVVDTIVRDTRFDVLSLNLCRDEESGIRLFSREKEAVTESPGSANLQLLLAKNTEELRQASALLRQLAEEGNAAKSNKAGD
jgi:nitrilase